MKKLIVVYICLAMFLGIFSFVPIPKNVEAGTTIKDPTETGTLFNQWTNPNNALDGVDDTYATETTNLEQQSYGNFGFTDQGTEISSIELGLEYMVDNAFNSVIITMTRNGGTTYCTGFTETGKLVDDDAMIWNEIWSPTNPLRCGAPTTFDWDDLSDSNFHVRITASIAVAGTNSVDTVQVRVTWGDEPFKITIFQPSGGSVVFKTQDIQANVEIPDNSEISGVSFRILGNGASDWFRAINNTDTGVWEFEDFNSAHYANNDYWLNGFLNLSDGRQTTCNNTIIIENNDEDFIGKTFPADKTKGGVPDGVLLDPYYMLIYTVEHSGTGTSVHFEDMRIGTSDTVLDDEIEITNHADMVSWVWVNSTTAILNVSRNMTFFDGGGGVEIYVNSSTAFKAFRETTIRRSVEFNWSYDQDTSQYSVSLLITNSLSYTMDVDFFYVGKAPNTFIDQKSIYVKDLTNGDELDSGEDFAFDSSGFYLMFTGLASGDSRNFFFSYFDYVEGTDILVPTINIYDGDLDEESATRDGKQYTLARKIVSNSNDFDYTGRIIVIWRTSELPDQNSVRVDDEAGSNYDIFWDSDTQMTIQGTSFDAHESINYLIYYNAVSEKGLVDYMVYVLPFVLGICAIIALVTLPGVRSDDEFRRNRAMIIGGLSLMGVVLILCYLFVRYIVLGV